MSVTPSMFLLALSIVLFSLSALCLTIASVRENRNESDCMAAMLYSASGYTLGAGIACIFILTCMATTS
mgnify:CR=1 FL=1